MEKACCGFGHREVFENLSDRISSAVRMAAEQGCEIFYTGAINLNELLSFKAGKNGFLYRPNISCIGRFLYSVFLYLQPKHTDVLQRGEPFNRRN